MRRKEVYQERFVMACWQACSAVVVPWLRQGYDKTEQGGEEKVKEKAVETGKSK